VSEFLERLAEVEARNAASCREAGGWAARRRRRGGAGGASAGGGGVGGAPAAWACSAHVGLAVAPANRHAWIAGHVHWTTSASGGEGAVRELCDLILEQQGHREVLLQRYGAK